MEYWKSGMMEGGGAIRHLEICFGRAHNGAKPQGDRIVFRRGRNPLRPKLRSKIIIKALL